MENKKYIYTLLNFPKEGTNYGLFKSTSPKRAAKKAFGKLAKSIGLTNANGSFIVFSIKNINTKKEYKYIGSRVKLVKPIEVILKNGKKIYYKYEHLVGKYNRELNKINNKNKI
jgi:hypothetical protein